MRLVIVFYLQSTHGVLVQCGIPVYSNQLFGIFVALWRCGAGSPVLSSDAKIGADRQWLRMLAILAAHTVQFFVVIGNTALIWLYVLIIVSS